MTTALILRRQIMAMPRVPRERRVNISAAMVLVDAGILVARPVLVTVAILVAAAECGTATHPASVTNFLRTAIADERGPMHSDHPRVDAQTRPLVVVMPPVRR